MSARGLTLAGVNICKSLSCQTERFTLLVVALMKKLSAEAILTF